jgi:hypothetical protein
MHPDDDETTPDDEVSAAESNLKDALGRFKRFDSAADAAEADLVAAVEAEIAADAAELGSDEPVGIVSVFDADAPAYGEAEQALEYAALVERFESAAPEEGEANGDADAEPSEADEPAEAETPGEVADAGEPASEAPEAEGAEVGEDAVAVDAELAIGDIVETDGVSFEVTEVNDEVVSLVPVEPVVDVQAPSSYIIEGPVFVGDEPPLNLPPEAFDPAVSGSDETPPFVGDSPVTWGGSIVLPTLDEAPPEADDDEGLWAADFDDDWDTDIFNAGYDKAIADVLAMMDDGTDVILSDKCQAIRKMAKRGRDARTGRFITVAEAEANKATSVVETYEA